MSRFDVAAIRNRVDVATVLSAFGIDPPVGRRRIPCPLHDGHNRNFSVTTDGSRWACWSHCGTGDVIDLIARLTRSSVFRLARLTP